jgi:hypothetical protein
MTNRTDNVTANKGQVQRKSVLFLFTLDLPFVGHYIVCPVFIYSLDLPFVGHYIVCPVFIYAGLTLCWPLHCLSCFYLCWTYPLLAITLSVLFLLTL